MEQRLAVKGLSMSKYGKPALELGQQGLSWVKAAKRLEVSDKTAKRAVLVTNRFYDKVSGTGNSYGAG